MTTPPAGTLTIAEAAAEFSAANTYLSACTSGLPTKSTQLALAGDLQRWSHGLASAVEYGSIVEETRTLFARLMGTDPSRVASGSQTSSLVSIIAAGVPDGAEILCVNGDFSSVPHPFVQQAHRGVTVRYVSIEDLAASIRPSTHMVAFSLVQSATGSIADARAIRAAASRHGALTLCDTTQAVGWLPVSADDYDITVTHTYKWLCVPRGVAFMTMHPRLFDSYRPIAAGWYSSDNVWSSCYSTSMTLAPDASRFDVSPAWPAWVGARSALSFFNRLEMNEVRSHNVDLGNLLCESLGMDALDQAIVTWPDADGSQLARLTAAGIVASGRAGRARVAFHLWNSRADVERVVAALH